MRHLIIAALLFIPSCQPEEECCYDSRLANVTGYDIEADRYTPKGIGIDDPINPEFALNATELDGHVDDLEACLNENFLLNPVITEERGHCLTWKFPNGLRIKRECLTVKVPDDLYQSPCSDQWLFPCDVDDQYCVAKGIVPTEECPCNCRATVQDNNSIVTNHVLNVFKGELARIITTCNNPWIVPQIMGCL